MRRVDSIQRRQKLPKCPICGAEAFVRRNVVDGFYMGWSAGCPRYRIADGIHGVNTLEEAKERGYTVHGAPSKEEAVKRWIIIAKMEVEKEQTRIFKKLHGEKDRHFLGYKHPPYRGMRVAEIEDCPKERK